ncbi:hypothetical protein GCM10007382_03950 [Salinibacterium xinjiangense]|uniref:Uncharacterized protein n=1 Tax=Salinibacterium xinjiangense TaxID=386302 RepID=A0A2C8ZM18_9MICO|nr:hypothetical protein [Salinibacterium xinjiangense]GGK87251.1 hypothetical protein GCM10007382_03950 [Salinibacterium xinjiangense]SOE65965.1 hypothetical protein SAMN06296378_1649 [Salinibacterium xinjiangense]
MSTPNSVVPAVDARPRRLMFGLGTVTALVIIVGAIALGGSLTRSPAAAADEDQAPRGVGHAPIELRLSGLQLPTI